MTSSLRKFFLASAVVTTSALTANTAMAATLRVPFSFTVGNKSCPASRYTVTRQADGGIVTLIDATGSCSFGWVVSPGDPAPNDSRVVLRFDEVGQSHALQSVQYGAAITSRLDKKFKTNEYTPTRIIMGQ